MTSAGPASINIKLKVWRQSDAKAKGAFHEYPVTGVDPNSSFLEMLDTLNDSLVHQNIEPIAFDHDCREGICGACSMVINGNPHGPETGSTTCQLHMRLFKDGDTIVVEPFRARPFPVIKDLVIDRSALDRIIMAGGYISADTGNAPDAHCIPVHKRDADIAFSAAACIGCGACVATCKNASAQLFLAAKVSQMAMLPQGRVERSERVRKMVATMEAEGFGSCSNTGACEVVCPKSISLAHIARLHRELLRALFL
ncbi:MAG: succinate dehydrogenase/fumarate reductase iron-sulfur subunit [Azospirillum sp.]|nr:succinate dehydrogenase/fumarate reductase iron-sulfur subunit [Azospirillum sp.]